jgi:hypothetical protein
MDTEAENNSVAEEDVNTSPVADLSTEDQPSDDNITDDTTSPEQDNSEDDGEDVEYDGKTYRLPKELKEGFLRREDYTRKTQEVAEARKAVENERIALTQQQQVQETLIKEHAKVSSLEDYIAYYDNVDWDAADEQNPEVAQKEWRRYQQMQRQLSDAKTELKTKIDHRLKEQHSAQERALQETGKTLTRDIPGFNQALAQELVNEAAKYGFSQEDMLRDPDPRAWKLVHALYQASRNSTKQATGDRIAKQASTAPIKAVGGKSPPPSPLSDRADTKAWMEARQKQVRR